MVFLSSFISLLISCLVVLSITERRVLKSTITVDLFLFVVLPVFVSHFVALFLVHMNLGLLYLLGELIF